MYFVYILICNDKSLYCGYTNNLEKRIYTHNNFKNAAKYTIGRRPVELAYFEIYENKGSALSRELEIKKLKRTEKLSLLYFSKVSPSLKD